MARPRDSNPDRLGYKASADPVGPGRHFSSGSDHAASSGSGPSSASTTGSRRIPGSGVAAISSLSVVSSVTESSGTMSFSRSCCMESPPFRCIGRKVSNPRLKDQSLAPCHWTTPERMVVGGVNGYRPHYSWVEATRVSVNTLTPWSSRRVLTPRRPRWQRDALPLIYYCDGGTGWSLTSVARVAIGYLDPRSRCQGCGGGHRTPDDGG